MNERIFAKLLELKRALEDDERYKSLLLKEAKLNDSFKAYTLANKKDALMDKYHSLTLALDDNDPKVISLRKELVETRNKLETLPETSEYLNAYKDLQKILDQVDLILFDDLKLKKGNKAKL